MRKEIKAVADQYVADIDRAVRVNKTSTIVELYRFQADRNRNRIEVIRAVQCAIDQEVWCEIVNRPDFRSDAAGWVVA
jgi:hypothetical protein